MDFEMGQILRASEGRYLTPEEAKKVIDIARDFERRLAVLRALESKEAAIVKTTMELIFTKFPKFRERPMAEEKTTRDLSVTLKYIGHSMLRNDPEYLREKVLYWLQGIASSKAFLDVMKGGHEALQKSVAKHLSKADADEINRFVAVCIESHGEPKHVIG